MMARVLSAACLWLVFVIAASIPASAQTTTEPGTASKFPVTVTPEIAAQGNTPPAVRLIVRPRPDALYIRAIEPLGNDLYRVHPKPADSSARIDPELGYYPVENNVFDYGLGAGGDAWFRFLLFAPGLEPDFAASPPQIIYRPKGARPTDDTYRLDDFSIILKARNRNDPSRSIRSFAYRSATRSGTPCGPVWIEAQSDETLPAPILFVQDKDTCLEDWIPSNVAEASTGPGSPNPPVSPAEPASEPTELHFTRIAVPADVTLDGIEADDVALGARSSRQDLADLTANGYFDFLEPGQILIALPRAMDAQDPDRLGVRLRRTGCAVPVFIDATFSRNEIPLRVLEETQIGCPETPAPEPTKPAGLTVAIVAPANTAVRSEQSAPAIESGACSEDSAVAVPGTTLYCVTAPQAGDRFGFILGLDGHRTLRETIEISAEDIAQGLKTASYLLWTLEDRFLPLQMVTRSGASQDIEAVSVRIGTDPDPAEVAKRTGGIQLAKITFEKPGVALGGEEIEHPPVQVTITLDEGWRIVGTEPEGLQDQARQGHGEGPNVVHLRIEQPENLPRALGDIPNALIKLTLAPNAVSLGGLERPGMMTLAGSRVPNIYCEPGFAWGGREIAWLNSVSDSDGNRRWQFPAELGDIQSSETIQVHVRPLSGLVSRYLDAAQIVCPPAEKPAAVFSARELAAQDDLSVPVARPLFVYIVRTEIGDQKIGKNAELYWEEFLEVVEEASAGRLVDIVFAAKAGSYKSLQHPRLNNPVPTVEKRSLLADTRSSRAKLNLRNILSDAENRAAGYSLPGHTKPDVLVVGYETNLSCFDLERPLADPQTSDFRFVALIDTEAANGLTVDENSNAYFVNCAFAESDQRAVLSSFRTTRTISNTAGFPKHYWRDALSVFAGKPLTE